MTEYKDFVLTGNTVPKDEPEEHGTKVLRCTRKVIEGYADIYVGRVFRTREANKDTPRLMAEVSDSAI